MSAALGRTAGLLAEFSARARMLFTLILCLRACVLIGQPAVSSDYSVPLAALEQSQALIRSGNVDEGRKIGFMLFNTAQQEKANGDESPTLLYILGHAALIVGKASLAIPYLEDSLEQESSNLDALVALAKAYLETGRNDAAIQALLNEEERFGGTTRYRLFLSEVYAQTGKPAEAIPILEAYLDSNPDDSAVANFLLTLYQATEDSEKLLPLLDALESEGTIGEADKLLRLAGMQLESADLRGARRSLQQARSKNPDHPVLKSLFSRYYEISGDLSQSEKQLSRAILYWERSLEFDERNPTIRRKLGESYSESGDYDKSLEYLSGLLESRPSDPDFYLLLAKALHATGKQEAAFKTLDNVIRIAIDGGDSASVDRFLDLREALIEIDRIQMNRNL